MMRISIVACVCLIWSGPARADVVIDWNVIAAQAVSAGARPGPTPAFDFAMVHAAMHDAIQAIDGRFEPYCAAIPNASGSRIAAAATAAHDVLVSLFPVQAGTLGPIYDNYLAGLGLTGDPGVLAGQRPRYVFSTCESVTAASPPTRKSSLAEQASANGVRRRSCPARLRSPYRWSPRGSAR